MVQYTGRSVSMKAKRNNLARDVISFLLFCVITLSNYCLFSLYQNSIMPPFGLKDGAIIIRVNEKKNVSQSEGQAFLGVLEKSTTIINYVGSRKILYYYDSEGFNDIWINESSAYRYLADYNTVSLFGKEYNVSDSEPFPVARNTELVIPLLDKREISGFYYVTGLEKGQTSIINDFLKNNHYSFSIEIYEKKRLLLVLLELVWYKEGLSAIIFVFYSIISFRVFMYLSLNGSGEDFFIRRLYGANKTNIFTEYLKQSKNLLMLLPLSSFLLLFIVEYPVIALSLFMWYALYCAIVFIGICRMWNRMEII